MPKLSKITKRARATNMIRGLRTHFVQPSYRIGGRDYTPKQLVMQLQEHIDAIDEVDAKRAALAAAVARERAVARKMMQFSRYLKMAADALLGLTPDLCTDFGWDVPKRPGPKSVKAKLEGAAKARETRRLRGTMGKRQRKKIRG